VVTSESFAATPVNVPVADARPATGVKYGAVNRSTAGGAAATLAAFVAAVVTDVTIPVVNTFWDRHSLLGSFVASVLILGVTIQVVDQVTARRRVKERERVAGVQALIVFGQALRTAKVVAATPEERGHEDPASEVQALASMLLTASAALFDDPAARAFMAEVERFASQLFQLVRSRTPDTVTDADRVKLSRSQDSLTAAVQPLLGRLDLRDVTEVEDDALM
jgi:hypothetical protein